MSLYSSDNQEVAKSSVLAKFHLNQNDSNLLNVHMCQPLTGTLYATLQKRKIIVISIL